MLTRLIAIIGLITVVFIELAKGNINSVGTAAAILVVSVIILAIGGRRIVEIVIIAIPIYYFAKEFGITTPRIAKSILGDLLILVIVLYGIYIIVSGPFRRKR